VSGAAFAIRRAGPDDLFAAAVLFERVANQAMPWLARETQDAAAFLAAAADETVWVAAAEGRLVGLAALYAPDSFLHMLFVDAAWQGRGVGRALLDTVAAAAAGPLSLKVQHRNAAARRFYARSGFVEAGRGGPDAAPWLRLVRRN
jgi:GNAT superfamily N-acetyltransferase